MRVAEGERPDRDTTDGRSDDARDAIGGQVSGVRRREFVSLDQRRNDAEVGCDTPDHLKRAQYECQAVQQPKRENAHGHRERNERSEDDAQCGRDCEQAPLVGPVDECAGDRAEQDVRNALDDAQEGGGADVVREIEDQDREREPLDLVADRAGGHRGGEPSEPFVPQRA